MADNEKQFEQDIESFLILPKAVGKKPQMRGIVPDFSTIVQECSRKTMPWILRRFVPLSRILSRCNGHCLKNAAKVILRRSFIRPFKMLLIWRA